MKFRLFIYLFIVIIYSPISHSWDFSYKEILKWTGYEFVMDAVNHFRECKNQFLYNRTGLIHDFKTHLYGQHLISDVILRLLDTHLSNPQPKKSLVISLHGSTGTGKNHISRLIARNLFIKGFESDPANLIITTHYFKHKENIKEYKDSLTSWIVGNVSKCPSSLFIFDEMDKMPISLIDTIIPFIDFHESIQGIDFRKAIFILLSNSASGAINQKAARHWKEGSVREDLTLTSLESIISESAYNSEGGLWHSRLIERDLISAYIPLLPLERVHIKGCIEDYLATTYTPLHNKCKRIIAKDPQILNKIADLLHYEPLDLKIFSATGCKNVVPKVDFYCGK